MACKYSRWQKEVTSSLAAVRVKKIFLHVKTFLLFRTIRCELRLARTLNPLARNLLMN